MFPIQAKSKVNTTPLKNHGQTPLLEPPLATEPGATPGAEDDPEALGEEFDNQSNLESSSLPREDFEKPMKMLNLQPRQSKALQGKGRNLPNSFLVSRAALGSSSAISAKLKCLSWGRGVHLLMQMDPLEHYGFLFSYSGPGPSRTMSEDNQIVEVTRIASLQLKGKRKHRPYSLTKAVQICGSKPKYFSYFDSCDHCLTTTAGSLLCTMILQVTGFWSDLQ